MKNQIIISAITICFMLLFYACKDEDILLTKTPYSGNELKIDGYYCRQFSDKFRITNFHRDFSNYHPFAK
jgi:hypothetical protein